MPQTIVVTWDDLDALVAALAESVGREFDVLLAISRGGLVPAGMLAYRLDLHEILVVGAEFYRPEGGTRERPLIGPLPADELLAGRRVLVVDEVWETGKTMEAVVERVRSVGGRPVTAVLHYKPARSRVAGAPDHFAAVVDDWVRYPYKAGA
jgi:hypoxanthine phosphoribosyltransferase